MAAAARDPDSSVRERAQAASVVVGVLTVLLGADPLDIRGSSSTFRIADYALIACWLLVILLLLFAQLADGRDVGDKPKHRVRAMLWKLDRRSRKGATWLRVAFWATLLVGLSTAVVLVLNGIGIARDVDWVLVKVKDPELATIAQVCRRSGQGFRLYGTVQTGSLGDQFIVLKLDPRANSTCDEIKLPHDQIVAFVEHPCMRNHGLDATAYGFCVDQVGAK